MRRVDEVDEGVERCHGNVRERQVQQKVVGDSPHPFVRKNDPDHYQVPKNGHCQHRDVCHRPERDAPRRLHELVGQDPGRVGSVPLRGHSDYRLSFRFQSAAGKQTVSLWCAREGEWPEVSAGQQGTFPGGSQTKKKEKKKDHGVQVRWISWFNTKNEKLGKGRSKISDSIYNVTCLRNAHLPPSIMYLHRFGMFERSLSSQKNLQIWSTDMHHDHFSHTSPQSVFLLSSSSFFWYFLI